MGAGGPHGGRGLGGLRKKGGLKRAAGDIRRAREALEVEYRVYTSCSEKLVPYDKRHADLMESFAGEAEASKQVHKFGLIASQPMDINTGYDFGQRKYRLRWTDLQDNHKPLLLLLGCPCTLYCIYNRNINYRGRREELAQLQKQD